jgi:multiple sugar transport system substrate-binding protein
MGKLRKVLAIMLSALLVLSLTACQDSAETKKTPSTDASPGQTESSQTSSEAPAEPVKLKFTAPYNATEEAIQKLIQLAKDRLNVDLEFVELGKDQYPDKLAINILSGSSDLDFFYEVIPRLQKYVIAESILPLDELAQKAGVDLEAKYGSNLVKTKGRPYLVPNTKDIWITLYNKKIFDEAGVPYPTAENWTWEKYIETAKKVTNIDKGIYGSSMVLEWDSYKYMYAHQKGAQDYKEDGTSNFDDPLFAEGLKFLKDLSDEHKVQLDMLTYMSKKVAWDHFATGKFAMHINGGWSTCFVNDLQTYPRDWKYGILPMPYPEGEPRTSLAIVGGYAVVNGTKNAEMAFKVADLFAAEQYKIDPIRQPTTTDITRADLENYIRQTIEPFMESDGVTVEDYMNAWYNPEITLINEKVVGPADAYINQLFIDEGQLYLLGKQDLETTMRNIKEKADKAISEAENN